jgi:hypothetical protein
MPDMTASQKTGSNSFDAEWIASASSVAEAPSRRNGTGCQLLGMSLLPDFRCDRSCSSAVHV